MTSSVALSFIVLAAMAAASVLLGRVAVGALGGRWLRALTPDNAAASALLGTALVIVLFGRLALAGQTAGRIAAILAALAAVLGVIAIARGGFVVFRPRGPRIAWL